MPAGEIISLINTEDKKVALAVEQALPQIAALIDAVADKLLSGGRLFYIGAGTSGRLGVLDASECPPSFGVPGELVTGIIAGGETALRNAVENAEDDVQKGWEDLTVAGITSKDIVIGIAASGTTPYVLAAVEACRKAGISTGCITCNAGTPLAARWVTTSRPAPSPPASLPGTRPWSGPAPWPPSRPLSASRPPAGPARGSSRTAGSR